MNCSESLIRRVGVSVSVELRHMLRSDSEVFRKEFFLNVDLLISSANPKNGLNSFEEVSYIFFWLLY